MAIGPSGVIGLTAMTVVPALNAPTAASGLSAAPASTALAVALRVAQTVARSGGQSGALRAVPRGAMASAALSPAASLVARNGGLMAARIVSRGLKPAPGLAAPIAVPSAAPMN